MAANIGRIYQLEIAVMRLGNLVADVQPESQPWRGRVPLIAQESLPEDPASVVGLYSRPTIDDVQGDEVGIGLYGYIDRRFAMLDGILDEIFHNLFDT